MWEGDCVEELDLDQRIVGVQIEINVDHDVEDDNQAEDHKVRSDTLHFSNHVDWSERNKHLKHFNINCLNSISSSVWTIQSVTFPLIIQAIHAFFITVVWLFRYFCGGFSIAFQEVIKDLEATKNCVKNCRCPDETRVIPNLVIWDADLIVLDFFIDVVEFQVEFVDHGAISEVAATFSRLAPWDVDSV